MRIASLVLALAVSVAITGCLRPRPVWRELHFTRSKPAETDLIGTWRPSPDTLKDIRNRGKYPAAEHELILRPDHTFSMRNMPDWWSDGFGESHGKFESGDGTWELASDKNVWQIWVLRLRFPRWSTSIHLYRQRPPYLIFVRVGDPDIGDAMFFERSKA
jgi:hypothetical protein